MKQQIVPGSVTQLSGPDWRTLHVGATHIGQPTTPAESFESHRKVVAPMVARALELAGDVYKLTQKEREVVALVVGGLPNLKIAKRLGNTDKTIKHHVTSILEKFKVRTRAELFAHLVGSA